MFDGFGLQLGLSILWIFSIAIASIIYRRKNGKPIFPAIPENAIYVEKRAGAPWAQRCLLVVVTPEILAVTPTFPFTLFFLPEVYRMEKAEWLSSIVGVDVRSSMWPLNTTVRLKNGKKFRLRLKRPKDFAAVIHQASGKTQ